MTFYAATYDPADDKIRLSATNRLDAALYARVKAAGFGWAPKQEVFYGVWSPAREDLAIELAGEIEDEDTTLVERAETRADRFEDYGVSRAADAESARAAVARIADGIPLGQPILVGHHSERHARKDQERIQSGMRKAVNMWEAASYWRDRAAGAIRYAKYKERPDVRARRIKGLGTDRRRQEKYRLEAETSLKLWLSLERLDNDPDKQLSQARKIAGMTMAGHLNVVCGEDSASSWSAYHVLEPDETRYKACPTRTVVDVIEAAKAHYPSVVAYCNRWIAHLDNRLEYERAMLGEAGGTEADKTKPQKGGAVRCWASPNGGWAYIQKVNKVTVSLLDNWGNGGGNFTRTIPFDKLKAVMSPGEVAAAKDQGRIADTTDGIGFFLRDAEPQSARVSPVPADGSDADFAAMRTQLKNGGVAIVIADQLFPTPPEVAQRMILMADIQAGMRVLEPSAGTGALLRAMPLNTTRIAIEIVQELTDLCRPLATVVHCGDFLSFDPATAEVDRFDRVVMNPPFANGADIKHILLAAKFLRSGGVLVAICANGPRQTEELKPLVSTWTELPDDTFAAQGTKVRTVLLTINK